MEPGLSSDTSLRIKNASDCLANSRRKGTHANVKIQQEIDVKLNEMLPGRQCHFNLD